MSVLMPPITNMERADAKSSVALGQALMQRRQIRHALLHKDGVCHFATVVAQRA
jgi:hypothetical protein